MNCNLIKCDVYKQDGQTFYFFYIEMENGGVCRIVYLPKCNEHPGVLRSFVSCSLFFCLTDKLLMLTNGGRFMDGTTAYHTFDRVYKVLYLGNQCGMAIVSKNFSMPKSIVLWVNK